MCILKMILPLALAVAGVVSASAEAIKEGINYCILSPSGLAVDNQESFSPGSRIYLSKQDADKPSQVWRFVSVGNGLYCIMSPLSLKGIDNGGVPKNGSSIIQWDLNKTNRNQLWRIVENSDG
ncbi:MAG: RICIN domain-containing protein, partial [Paramuribaculum sp.]|nr:RICIN domain-containing protein [Paramuribaculum sp.]